MGTVSKKCAFDARKISGIYIDTRGRGPVEIKDLISARRNALKNGKKTAQILKGSGGGGGGGGDKGVGTLFFGGGVAKRGFGKLTCSHSSRGFAKTIQHPHANKATKLSILLFKQIFASKGFLHDGRESSHVGLKSDLFRGILLSKQFM